MSLARSAKFVFATRIAQGARIDSLDSRARRVSQMPSLDFSSSFTDCGFALPPVDFIT